MTHTGEGNLKLGLCCVCVPGKYCEYEIHSIPYFNLRVYIPEHFRQIKFLVGCEYSIDGDDINRMVF